MEMPKPSEADKDRFRALMPSGPGVEVKAMFGNLGAFVNGNMFAGLFGSSVGVKLPEDELAQLAAEEGSGPFGPSERPMGGYVALPPAYVADPSLAEPWVAKAVEYVSTMPPKVKKAAKKR
jgi:TfoX/Sxy family transcriptional regulator of competence genes